MPPAKSLLRRRFFGSGVDLESRHDSGPYKPHHVYSPAPPLTPNFERKAPNLNHKTQNVEQKSQNVEQKSQNFEPKQNSKFDNEWSDYMDLDEFLFQVSEDKDVSGDNSTLEEYTAHMKPDVDLLASLLTLGKMIQDQKLLIQQQKSLQEQNHSNDEYDKEPPVVRVVQVEPTDVNADPDEEIRKEVPSSPNKTCVSTDAGKKESNVISVQQTEPSSSIVSCKESIKESPFCNSSSSCVTKDYTNNREIPNYERGQKGKKINMNDECPQSSSSWSESDHYASACAKGDQSLISERIKDIDYWDRRKRNNLAAKKSREQRRKKELEILKVTKQLESENSQLAAMLKRLTARNELLESRIQDIRQHHPSGLSAAAAASSSSSGPGSSPSSADDT